MQCSINPNPRFSKYDIYMLPESFDWSQVSFSTDKLRDPEAEARVKSELEPIIALLVSRGAVINPFVLEIFEDSHLFYALPESLRKDSERFADFIEHSSKFDDAIQHFRERNSRGDMTGLLGPDVIIPPSIHADGRLRDEEEGPVLQLQALIDEGIDPAKVLMFRVTQPSDNPKPEFYWTSDYFETVNGLGEEVPPGQRATAVILVGDLATINGNEGLIQDVNDDSGMSVRQIGLGTFNQKSCIAILSAY